MSKFVSPNRLCPGNACDGSGWITQEFNWERVRCPYCDNEADQSLKDLSLDKIFKPNVLDTVNKKKPVYNNILREIEREKDY